MHLEHIGAKDISKSQLLFSKCFSFSKIKIKIKKNYDDFEDDDDYSKKKRWEESWYTLNTLGPRTFQSRNFINFSNFLFSIFFFQFFFEDDDDL